MTKIQKVWMWIFIAMFAIPEILFFTTPAMILTLFGKHFSEISSFITNYQFFLVHPVYLLVVVLIEWIAIMSLLILNLKLNKKFFAFLALIILLWLSFIFCLIYITGISMGA